MAATTTTGSVVPPWVSGLPPEVWNLVAELIHSRETLLQLIRTCRAFHAIFIPALHRKHCLRLSRKPARDWLSWPIPSFLHHVRDFEVHLDVFEDEGVEYEGNMNNLYAIFVANLLEVMPNLKSLVFEHHSSVLMHANLLVRWTDSSYQDGFTPTLILRNTQLLNRLRDTGALKNLSIQFASQYTADGFGSDKLWTQFHGFHNLTSLELYHFYCEEDKLVKEISRILCHNPRLQKLGLGIAHDADCDGNPEMIITNDNYDFLEKLCERYASRQGTVPLSLHTLRLGHGMFLNHKKSGTTENWLKKLVKLDEIRTLHIFNSILLDMEEDEPAETVIDWSLFEDCKSIRQLSVSRISSDVIEWLRGGGKTVEELLIADHYDMYDNEGMDRFNILNLPHLSMLYVREIWVDKRTEDDDWDDTDSDASDPEEVEEADTMDLDASELESPRMDPSVMTVLDRLPDGGVHLTRLALCITFEDQWTLFATHLPKLKHLTYLRLDSKSAHGGRFPPMQASIWSGINRYIEIAMRYVQLARYLCSSLQFARVGEWAWQITVPLGVDLADAGSDIYDLIKLRRLDFDEMMSIELFSIHTFTCQSGLLGKETWHEEMSEEESHRMDLQMEEIDAAMREGRPVRRLFTSIGEGPDIHIPDFL